MLRAVDFDDQLRRRRIKVNDVIANGPLSIELHAQDLLPA
jgi:hypothetical protein